MTKNIIDETPNEGMTLRDYFAAHAPPEIPIWFPPGNTMERFFRWRWHYADQMLAARTAR